ncbi:MAG: hypothetical protein ACRYF3_16835 [Janthinobacterium lividum]
MSATRATRYRSVGEAAATSGVALRALLDLYLPAAWRLWHHLPAVGTATEDYEQARRAFELGQRLGLGLHPDDPVTDAADLLVTRSSCATQQWP